jgi:hypothetical protein
LGAITDPQVIATGRSDHRPILRRGTPTDSVAGIYLELSDAERAAADDYAVDDYGAPGSPLQSGVQAWVYTRLPTNSDVTVGPPRSARTVEANQGQRD